MGIPGLEQNITIYYKDHQKGTWCHLGISGATWYGGTKISIGEEGLRGAHSYKVRIPVAQLHPGYTRPSAFNQMKDKTGYWTVQSGDVIALGAVDIEVQRSIAEVLSACESFTVVGERDNRRGPIGLQHILIEGE